MQIQFFGLGNSTLQAAGPSVHQLVYLAGPIDGVQRQEVLDWREEVSQRLNYVRHTISRPFRGPMPRH